jgi:K+-transporting ATPase c subunit
VPALVLQEKLSLVFTFWYRDLCSHVANHGMGRSSNGSPV